MMLILTINVEIDNNNQPNFFLFAFSNLYFFIVTDNAAANKESMKTCIKVDIKLIINRKFNSFTSLGLIK